jgi:hypothetical protein
MLGEAEAKMTPAQIAEAQRLASDWMRSHPVSALSRDPFQNVLPLSPLPSCPRAPWQYRVR